jgi:two-component system response regulator PilR (NtrC family)
LVRLDHLPESVTGVSPLGVEGLVHIPKEGVDLESRIGQIEKRYLVEALRAAGGVRKHAAELLRVSYRSFRHYAKKYGL